MVSASASGGARGGAALEQRAHQPALGGLVEVADHGALASRPRGARGRSPPCGRGSASGAPERCVGRGAQVDDEAGAGGLAHGRRRARARQWAETTPRPGRLTPPARRYDGIRSPGPDQPEDRRGDRRATVTPDDGRRHRGSRGRATRRARPCRSRRREPSARRAGPRCGVRRRPGWVPARAPAWPGRDRRGTAPTSDVEHLLARGR